jgi:hypothetical protein
MTPATPERASSPASLVNAQAAAAFHLPLALLCAASLPLMPLAALGLSVLLLINLPTCTRVLPRRLLGLSAAVALAMLAGNRPIDLTLESNDIEGYYEIYRSLMQGESVFDTAFGAGFEVALPALMAAAGALLPTLSMNGLMFCFSLAGALLMLGWVETAFYGRGERLPTPALLGISMIMLNLYFATQLSRQFLSLIVLLYAFTASTRRGQAGWLLLATSFHLTALPFFAVYQLARRGPLGWLAIIVAAVVFRVWFVELLAALEILPEAVGQKLLYYAEELDADAATDLASLRIVGLLAALSIAVLLVAPGRVPEAVKPWLALPWITAIVHLLLLPVPLAPLRTTLMVHSVVPGLVAFRLMEGRQRGLMLSVLNTLLAYKVVTLGMLTPNLQPGIDMLAGFVQ